MYSVLSKFVFLAAFLVSCAGYSFVSQQTKNAAQVLGAKALGEVKFDKGTDQISNSAKDSLKSTIDEASAKGSIDHVAVLAWADREYPSEKNPASTASVNLADNRLSSIEKYLKTALKVPSVVTVNMAKRPNDLQELLKTNGAAVRDTTETAGAAPTNKDATGIFGQKGQASKAVVMVFLKGDTK